MIAIGTNGDEVHHWRHWMHSPLATMDCHFSNFCCHRRQLARFQFVMVLSPKYYGYGSHDYTIDSQFITAVVVHYNLFCLELHRSMPLSPGKMPLIC